MNPTWVLLYLLVVTELIFLVYVYYTCSKVWVRKLWYIVEGVYILLLLFSFWDAFTASYDSYGVRLFKNAVFIIGLSKAVVCLFFILECFYYGLCYVSYKIKVANSKKKESKQLFSSYPPLSMTRGHFLRYMGLGMALMTSSIFFYGWRNKYAYKVFRSRITFPDLPDAFRGLRIVQLSDIHVGSFVDKEAVLRGVEMAMSMKGDIIFFTGDLVNNKAEEMEGYQDIFARLQARLGVYSILGNHDYGDYVRWESEEEKETNLARVKEIHKELGWRLLLNEHMYIYKGEDRLALIGVENWSATRRFSRYGDLTRAMRGIKDKDFKILLSHDPTHWDTQVMGKTDIQLTFSGHTHGMQLGVEIPFFRWSPAQFLYPHWAGLYQQGKQYLYVNRGFGYIGYQGRVGVMPEITVMDLL